MIDGYLNKNNNNNNNKNKNKLKVLFLKNFNIEHHEKQDFLIKKKQIKKKKLRDH